MFASSHAPRMLSHASNKFDGYSEAFSFSATAPLAEVRTEIYLRNDVKRTPPDRCRGLIVTAVKFAEGKTHVFRIVLSYSRKVDGNYQ